jgi:hypothetical protein
MYKSIYFLILNKNFSSKKIFIRNKSMPICLNCLHFIKYTNNEPYDPFPSRNEKYGSCKKFGEVNMVTGILEYDLAIECRLNESKCGIFGSEFNEKSNLD